MRITVIGGNGNIGSRVVAEAANRGHEVVAASRSGSAIEGAAECIALDLGDTAAVVDYIDNSDVTLIAVPASRTGGSHAPLIDAHAAIIAAEPSGRVFVVGGFGSLLVGGVMIKDSDAFPAAFRPTAGTMTEILDRYRASNLDWTYISPPAGIAPGARTGSYVLSDDTPAGQGISIEDFAVAIVDEMESPTHRRARFTAAN